MNLLSKFKSKFGKIALSFSLLLGTLAGVVGVSSVGYAASRAGVSNWLIPNVSASYDSSPSLASPEWTCLSDSSFQGSLSGGFLRGYNSTLVLTNKLGNDAQVIFNYRTEGSAVTVDGKACNSSTSGTINRKWPNGATIEIKIEVAKKVTAKVFVSDFSLIDLSKMANVTFTKGEYGTFSIAQDGNPLSFNTEYSFSPATLLKLKATPDEGYVFIGWKKSSSFISYVQQFDYMVVEGTYTITAVFSKQDYPVFCTNNQFFDDLNKANEAALSGTKQIFVSKSGPLGKGNYNLSSGVSLLVPMDANNQFIRETPIVSPSSITPTEYRCLTLRPGAVLTVSDAASISVASTLFAHSGGGTSGRPTGGYGRIQLDEGSEIVLAGGSSLYCWGYISGEGTVTAESGSTVHEMFQIGNWMGGQATNGIEGNKGKYKLFPFNQYFVQNITASLALKYGAQEKCYTSVNISGEITSGGFTFIGSGSEGMFRLTSGLLIKKYNPALDRLEITVDGAGVISNISVNLGKKVDSKNFVLPITSNIDITLKSGTSYVNQDLALIPGSSLTINDDAVLEIASGYSVYVYDQDQLGNYASTQRYFTIPYTVENGTKVIRGESSLVDAKIDINGRLNVKGSLFTTNGGAALISSKKSGKIQFGSIAANSTTYQFDFSKAEKTSEIMGHVFYNYDKCYISIPVTCAVLQNGDQSYYTPKSSDVGNLVVYSSDKDQWMSQSEAPVSIVVHLKNEYGETYDAAGTSKLFTFPASSSMSTIWSHSKPIYLWVAEDTGEIFQAGLRVTNTNFSNRTFIAFMGGWITDPMKNETFFYDSTVEGNDPVSGQLYSTLNQEGTEIQTFCFGKNGALQDSFSGVYTNPKDNQIYLLNAGIVRNYYGLYRDYDAVTSKADYYFFGSDNYAYKSGTYHLSSNKLNGYFAEGSFTFDSNGVLTSFTSEASFSVGEGGSLNNNVFTLDGVKAGVGLFTLSNDNHVYYAKDDGSMAKNETVYVTKTNGIKDSSGNAIEEGLYWFDGSGYMFDASYQTMQKGA